MTPEMVERARANAAKSGYENIEFRLGEIEQFPVSDNSVDAVISNCVINLSPDKRKVFAEAFRVLKPGGRLIVSDIVTLKDLPGFIKDSIEAYVGCVSGAVRKEEYIDAVEKAGFRNVEITGETPFPIAFVAQDPAAQALIKNFNVSSGTLRDVADSIVSIKVRGEKP